jgi:hypothetical protein
MQKGTPPSKETETGRDSPKVKSGRSLEELAAESRMLKEEAKERLIPPVGHIVYSILQGPDGSWRRLAFRVSHRNIAKARCTIELLGWANEPRPDKAELVPDPRPAKEGTVTLDVHDGVMGGGTEFKR